ncbi:MAG: CRTAC1 family protein [Pseudomonadales bacterium]|nr:CRTAC1 family protein [Pseudomonadales bacterium]NRA18253.1 CRTAC1 family protein [Oceanospirillaceae bacterium]
MKILKLLSFCTALLTSVSCLGITSPNMHEETLTSGISHQYKGGWEYFVGGGVAVFDCNDDQYPELFFAAGVGRATLYLNNSELGQALRFNKKVQSELSVTAVTGAYPLDIDGDGIMDLAVLRVGENILFKGLGNCQFENANRLWGFDGGSAWTTAFAATWEGDNQLPSLAFGNYVDRDLPGAPFGTCHNSDFYRPDKKGQYRHNTPLIPGYCALSMLFTDWNRSGTPSLRIANDRQYYRGGHEQLWKIPETNPPLQYSAEEGWRKQKIWGMGIASTDLNRDGKPDYYITSMADNKLSTLQTQDGSPRFKDIALERGVTAHRPFIGNSVLPSTGWHAQFDDVNNDSYTDLYVVKGNVEEMSDFAQLDPNNLFLGTPQGRFIESAERSAMLSFKRGRGGSLVDLNLDGLLDVVVVNRKDDAQLWRNLGAGRALSPAPMGNWLALKIQQAGGNRNAIGAFIEVRIADRTQSKEITVGGGHGGDKAVWHHFGIGVAERAIARVQWPDGQWSPWIRLFANQHARIRRDQSTADTWLPFARAKTTQN